MSLAEMAAGERRREGRRERKGGREYMYKMQ